MYDSTVHEWRPSQAYRCATNAKSHPDTKERAGYPALSHRTEIGMRLLRRGCSGRGPRPATASAHPAAHAATHPAAASARRKRVGDLEGGHGLHLGQHPVGLFLGHATILDRLCDGLFPPRHDRVDQFLIVDALLPRRSGQGSCPPRAGYGSPRASSPTARSRRPRRPRRPGTRAPRPGSTARPSYHWARSPDPARMLCPPQRAPTRPPGPRFLSRLPFS